ncbi:hypothetical protein PDE_03525 [Penicillium oxalicum 114-2]|uniref:GAR domain-containing protein n=1 Tax=Penicillium oxalicum (strain 114-2 / CGMCC 5302) TaxID=933388 RepID=S7ZE59_PENO1|nr:hypothetical protein PDE_03525 [Penicillium oxalicum 114-2]
MATTRTASFRPSIRLSPVHSRENSRSTSPDRSAPSSYQKIDPLLSNLSPESTLLALTSTEAVPSNGNFSHNVLSQSISQVSPAERAVGIRAAIAAQNLNVWYKEVRSWAWPALDDAKLGAGFMPPAETSVEADVAGSNQNLPLDGPQDQSGSKVEFYGSLPATLVGEYERRIDEIRDGMENLNVEELKEHVLNAHIPSRSRPSSSTSSGSVPPPLSYVQLSDFTAVVTATILRALPLLSRLTSLLTTWDVRLLVLRQVPGLLRELKATRHALDRSLEALRTTDALEDSEARQTDSHLLAEHGKIESAVVAVGRRMDRALDSLEGRQDSLPESWIDDLENIELDFASWSVEAERYRLRTKWLCMREGQKTAELNAQDERENERSPSLRITVVEETTKQPPTNEAGSKVLSPIGESIEIAELKSHSRESKIDEDHQFQDSENRGMSLVQSEMAQLLVSVPDAPVTTPSLPAPESSSPCSQGQDFFSPQNPVNESLQDHHRPSQTHRDEMQPMDSSLPFDTQAPRTPEIGVNESTPCAFFSEEARLPSERMKAVVSPKDERLMDCDPFVQVAPMSDSVEANTGSHKLAMHHPAGGLVQDHLSTDRIGHGGLPNTDKSFSVDLLSLSPRQTPKTTLSSPNSSKPAELWEFGARLVSVDRTSAPTANPHPAKNPEAGPDSPHSFSALIWKPKPQSEPASHSNSRPASATTVDTMENSTDKQPKQEQSTFRKPLQSPIKLAKHRPGKLDLKKETRPRQLYRRSSTGSSGSLLSDNSSLLSSPDAPEPQTGSSRDVPLMTLSRETLPHVEPGLPQEKHILRADQLLRLDNVKSTPRGFSQTRAVSLPLERFINDDFDFDQHDQSESDVARDLEHLKSAMGQLPDPVTAHAKPSPAVASNGASRVHRLARGRSASDLKDTTRSRKTVERPKKVFGMNTAHRALLHQDQPKSARLRQRLTAHPSLESLGMKRQELPFVEEDEAEVAYESSRASSPMRCRPRDHLDEKIDSILSGLPGRIHLVNASHDPETSMSNMDRRARGRCQSESPRGAAVRSTTPAPSMMLMPAARRRLSHAHKPEDSCVKLYHLHHGGQTAPTKLFVRTVGEEKQRVMVRVGGGWADLGEYLREYLTHHGRRKVSETPRVEVQGLTSKTSPSYPSPAAAMTPATTSPYLTSGRATPSRPPSVISARPASSLTVRKRRGSNVSETFAPRSVTAGNLSSFISPPQALPSRQRRVSMSSSFSYNNHHSSTNLVQGSVGHDSQSAPLGLAGPKPRSRHISMSPEGEAWVEDVLQQTRRSSSAHPPTFALNSIFASEKPAEVRSGDRRDHHTGSHTRRLLPKVSSVSDIRSVGSSKQVSLRGLGNVR